MNNPPLVILGMDAGDPDLILAWAREGFLPTIASILERGTFGRLVGPEMISVHGVWTSFFSGVSVHEHGNYLQRPLSPGTYELRAIHPRDIAAPPFWVDSRRALMTVDVPDSHPLPQLNGVQLVNWGNHPMLAPPEGRPEHLVSEIRAAVGPPIQTDERHGSRWRDRRTLARILRRVEQKGAVCRYLLSKGRYDLVVVVFGDAHAADHRFRKYQPPAATAAASAGDLRDAVRQTYAAIDREIGRLLQGLPEQPNVFVVSNSGIIDGYPVGDWMESFCRELGYQRLIEPTSALGKLQALAGTAPGIWHSVRGRRTRLQAERLATGTDWARTTAFAIPGYYTGYVRVNLKGREPLGVVGPGAEYEALIERLKADFLQLVDAKTGSAVIERVTCTANLFGGGPPLRLPDLVVDWRHLAASARRIVHPKAVLVRRGFGRPRGNYHSASGLVLAAGPSIQRHGRAADFSPLDFAPLFRTLMAEPPPERASGGAIEAFMGNDNG
jgi:predicted AlkP superfamily phosphohydrolase/phosphomutase